MGERQRLSVLESLVNDMDWVGGANITHLDETNGSRLFAEALSAEVKTVLADETSLVGTETARGRRAMRFSREGLQMEGNRFHH